MTQAPASASSTTAGRCSGLTSGGHSTKRRAMPSSSISATAAVSWSRAQTQSHELKVIDDKGLEIHTLMGDQYNVLVAHLEATGQTNALELFRQYRCAHVADLASSELRETILVLQSLRERRTDEAVRLLEQRLSRYAGLMCNSYGCLSATNRERVKLESLEQARDYQAKWFPAPAWDAGLEKAVNEVLRLSSEKPKK